MRVKLLCLHVTDEKGIIYRIIIEFKREKTLYCLRN